MRQSDVTHQQVADDGVGLSVERIAPLLSVFGVAPAGLVGVDVRERAELESLGLGLIGFQRAAQRSGIGERIDTVPDLGACLARRFSGACQRDIREPTQTHVAALVADLNAKNPTARAALVDLKPQACNAADEVQAGRRQPAHCKRSKLFGLASH